jgi:flavin-dependent dehydrogenase
MVRDTGWFHRGLAIEANLSCSAQGQNLVFDFAPVANGYGWIFPKGDHINVGIYSLAKEDALSRSQLATYITHRFGQGAEAHAYTGQYLGWGAGQHRVNADGVFLVGDAGGFADPLTGEGIYGAIVSGQAAAEAICAALHGTGSGWEVFAHRTAGLRQNLRIAERAAASFYADPGRGWRAMKMPFLRHAILKSYAEGFDLSRWISIARPILSSLEPCSPAINHRN